MKQLHLDFILKSTGGTLLSRQQEIFDGIATDTRVLMKNKLFIALKGEAFDAHLFLNQAIEAGATALLIHAVPENIEALKASMTVVLVTDTLRALQDLAHDYRHLVPAQIIGIAGSNGKTTSKEFCAGLIGLFRKVHYSKGSFNNHWGVPFTLLAMPEETEVSIVEMGMNHAGELARLAEIADPDVAVCTYVGVEHIEHFGTVEEIAKAEEEIYIHSPRGAKRIFNLDNEYTLRMYEKATSEPGPKSILTFSENKKADVQFRLKKVTMNLLTIEGEIDGICGEAEVPVFGRHNLTNLMVAASAGLAVGLSPGQIWSGLCECRTNWGRNQLVQTQSGALILFDGYNSNPDSMKALLGNISLVETSGKKFGVFAEMRELGLHAAQLHEEVGVAVGKAGLDQIWFYGPSFSSFEKGLMASRFNKKFRCTADFETTAAFDISKSLGPKDIVVVKGSRGMELERFVHLCQPLNFTNKQNPK